MGNDKSQAASAGWHLKRISHPFHNRWLRIREDQIEIEGHGSIEFTYIEHVPAVLVVPVTAAGDIVLIRQYRYTVDEWLLEIPAGGTHDTGDAPLEDVARKELEEEIGASCEELEHVASFYPYVAQGDEVDHVFIAWGTTLDREPDTEPTENIEVRPTPASEALRMARSGQLKAGQSAHALLLCEACLRERGYL